MTKHIWVQLLVIFISFSAGANPGVKLDVQKKTLPNGITMLVNTNHKLPLVSFQIWVKVGSRDELPGKTGLAHLFEHLMFTGTPKYPANQFEALLEKNGVTHNAFTTHDFTVYFEDLPASKLDLVMDLESDRFKNLTLSKEILDTERKVVQEERLMRSEQSIDGLMTEKLWTLSFDGHAYKNPVIGWPQDLERLSLDDCNGFFKKHYVPSNMIIVVAGDVDADATFKSLEKHFGDLTGDADIKPELKDTLVLTKEKRFEIPKDVRAERVLIGYKIPKQSDPAIFPLDVLSLILAQGKTSRLYKRLVTENGLASSVEASSSALKDAGVFEIEMSLRVGADLNKALAVLNSELEQIAKQPVTAKELKKAKFKVLRETYGSLFTNHGRAHNLAYNELLSGTYMDLFDDLAKYEKISAQDVMAVAQAYLRPSNRVVVLLRAKK